MSGHTPGSGRGKTPGMYYLRGREMVCIGRRRCVEHKKGHLDVTGAGAIRSRRKRSEDIVCRHKCRRKRRRGKGPRRVKRRGYQRFMVQGEFPWSILSLV